MDMLDYRMAVILNEERVRSHLRERSIHRRLEQARRQPQLRLAGRSRWRVADVVGIFVAIRDARFGRGARPAPNR